VIHVVDLLCKNPRLPRRASRIRLTVHANKSFISSEVGLDLQNCLLRLGKQQGTESDLFSQIRTLPAVVSSEVRLDLQNCLLQLGKQQATGSDIFVQLELCLLLFQLCCVPSFCTAPWVNDFFEVVCLCSIVFS
jgi:hypothetical protein